MGRRRAAARRSGTSGVRDPPGTAGVGALSLLIGLDPEVSAPEPMRQFTVSVSEAELRTVLLANDLIHRGPSKLSAGHCSPDRQRPEVISRLMGSKS